MQQQQLQEHLRVGDASLPLDRARLFRQFLPPSRQQVRQHPPLFVEQSGRHARMLAPGRLDMVIIRLMLMPPCGEGWGGGGCTPHPGSLRSPALPVKGRAEFGAHQARAAIWMVSMASAAAAVASCTDVATSN